MKKIIHFPENERGKSDLWWLKSNFSFSFWNYYNPQKMWFWTLRVINNDIVKAWTGFGMHHHDNMEIITIPLSGSLTHRDSLWNEGTIYPNEVQSMSAWTGIEHSEMNLWELDGEFFQIWIETKNYDITPEYHQKKFSADERNAIWQYLAWPDRDKANVVINQDAYIYRTTLKAWKELKYTKKIPENEIYVMNIFWEIELEWEVLKYRDALWIIWCDSITIRSNDMSDILLIEVPYHSN